MPSLSHETDNIERTFRGMMQRHEDNIAQMMSLIVKKTPIDDGAFLDEYMSNNSSSVSLNLQTDRHALIQQVLISADTVTAGATLSIGGRVIPISASITIFPLSLDTLMVVKPQELVVLNVPGASNVFVEIMGKILSGTDWSRV